MNNDGTISIDIDNDLEKRYKFEILQHALQSFDFSNFTSRQPPLRQLKYVSAQRRFYLEHVRNNYQKLWFPTQTQKGLSLNCTRLKSSRFKLLSSYGVSEISCHGVACVAGESRERAVFGGRSVILFSRERSSRAGR